jgi:lipopolysaccharide/colanic/teichoic acid biosynthesis glycosyltransferase
MEFDQGTGAAPTKGAPLWKRLLDVSCIIAAMPFWASLGLIIAVMIKVVSRGPVFFKQERIGHRGKSFTCWKFRTMIVGADTDIHASHLKELMTSNQAMTKLDAKGDPRLIRFGLLLRSLGLDELPQIFNVLKGEMSLVGPRPCLPYEYAQYLPAHRRRCHTLPGLTGLWQISGKNNRTFQEMIDLDVYYAQHRNLRLDLRIMIMTIPAILAQVCGLKKEKRAPKPERSVGAPATGIENAAPPRKFITESM